MNARQTAIVVFMGFGLGVLAGQRHECAERRAEVAELRSAHAEERRLASRAATARLQTAQERGDRLTDELAEHERQLQTLTKEKRDALKKVTSGRACLGAAALRVLDGAPGLRVTDLPEAAGSTAAADGPVATDSDIGQWSLAAGAQYEQCRQRLGTLIDWHRKEPQ